MNSILLLENDPGLERVLRGALPEARCAPVRPESLEMERLPEVVIVDLLGAPRAGELFPIRGARVLVLSADGGRAPYPADVQLGRPFFVQRVVEEARGLLGRPGAAVRRVGPLALYLNDERAEARGVGLGLSEAEFRLLEALTERPGAVVGRAELQGRMWRKPVACPKAVDVVVLRLRKKIEPWAGRVVSHRGLGYSFAGAPATFTQSKDGSHEGATVGF